MKRITNTVLSAVCLAAVPASVQAKAVSLGFEGLQTATFGVYQRAQVWQFYDGGYSRSEDGGQDLVLGPKDLNVAFDADAKAIRSANGGAAGTGPFGPRYLDEQPTDPINPPSSGPGSLLTGLGLSALIFTTSDAVVLNYATGFDAGFSFWYASTAPVTVTLYSGVGLTGTSLGGVTLDATPTCSLDDNTYCAWSVGAIAITGVAKSVEFKGVNNQALFDNVTFGATTPVPEPSNFGLMALGLAALGVAARRRRHP